MVSKKLRKPLFTSTKGEMLLGTDYLIKNGVRIDLKRKEINIGKNFVEFSHIRNNFVHSDANFLHINSRKIHIDRMSNSKIYLKKNLFRRTVKTMRKGLS
jgi:hypothetical protein